VKQRYIAKCNISTLVHHPKNPRHGNLDAISDSIDHNGWYGAVIVQKGSNQILAGNHRILAAKRSGMATVPVIELDIDDDLALRVLLADNKTNDLASYDDEQLVEILQELSAADNLAGSGYSENDLRVLLASMSKLEADQIDAFAEWSGMPEYESADMNSVFRVVIHFATSDDSEAFFNLIERPKKTSMWWPEHDGHIGSNVNEVYVADAE